MNGNTLVYGLAKDYEDNKEWIASHFHVTGYCDQDESRLPATGAVRKEELRDRLGEFELVLVTADPVSIVEDLIRTFRVPEEKIRVLFYEMAKEEPALRRFYGENAEDALLMLVCGELGLPLAGLTYIEIGTNDPVRFNNTYNLYRAGAHGLLVDPLPAVGRLAAMARPGDRFLHAAVSAKSSAKPMTFYASKSSLVSSLSEEHHHAWDGITHNEVYEIPVDVIGINEIIDTCPSLVDMLLVDAEGEDEKIMRALDYAHFHPAVIMVEMDHLDTSRAELIHFMRTNDYLEYTTIAYNTIFVAKDAWERRHGA